LSETFIATSPALDLEVICQNCSQE